MRSICVARLLFGLVGCACSFELSGSGSVGGGEPSPGIGGGTSSSSGTVGWSEPTGGTGSGVAVCPTGWVPDGHAEGGAGGVAGSPSIEATQGLVRGTGDLTVLLVFDKSGSMAAPWETKSRWESASDAFLKGLEGVESDVTVGAIVFPQGDAASGEIKCGVPPLEDERQIQFQAGTSFVDRWQETGASHPPEGGTPLGLAFRRADDAIEHAEACGLLEGRFRVVVVTDGEPNCGTTESQLLAYARSWRAKGIEVHVLGLPGSAGAARLLDSLANVGGTDEHVPTETVEGAEDEFWHIVR